MELKNIYITIISILLTACSSIPSFQPAATNADAEEFNKYGPATQPEPVDTLMMVPLPIISSIEFDSPYDLSHDIEHHAGTITADELDRYLQKQIVELNTGYTDIWQRIRDNLEFQRHLDKRSVKERVAWYARNQEYLDRVAQRATPYIFHIMEELKKRNMPVDLALLPIVESAYHPFAYSRSHASGIWQFIPSTGKIYGLKQNWWYDGRRDIFAATNAALNYLEKLYKQFDGDWQHALASYNSGEYNVARSINRNRRADKATDFFSLRLPRETRGYVPSLLAVAEIISDPGKYGINLIPIPDKPYFEKVEIDGQLDLSTAATLSELTMDELYTLNPGFNRWATDPDGPHYMLIPLDKKDQFIAGLKDIPPDERVGWNRHVIKQGETLSEIAEKHRTSITIIKQSNNLRGNLIRAGHSLVIPTSKKPGQFYTLSYENRWLGGLKREGTGNKYIYSVRSGDSLWTIGRRYDVTIRQLTEWNGINPRHYLRPGQKLTLWLQTPGETPQQSSSRNITASDYSRNEDGHIQYTVKKGDSLWLISRQFGVTVAQLQKWNKLTSGKYLQPGQKLVLLAAPALASGA